MLLALIAGPGLGCDAWNEAVLIASEQPADAGTKPPEDAGSIIDAGASPDVMSFDAGVERPDLFIVRADAPPTSINPGTGFLLDVDVGTGDSGLTSQTTLLARLVPQHSGVVQPLASAQLPALGAQGRVQRRLDLWIGAETPPQRYCIEIEVDPDGAVDEQREDNNVVVAGCLWVSGVQVQPQALEFGTVGLGCTATATLTLSNRSQAPVQITRASPDVERTAFEVLALVLPYSLESGATVRLPVRYLPTGMGLHRADLLVEHGALLGAVSVPMVAAAVQAPEHTEHFEAWPRRRVDVLLVVDDSPTMHDEQAQLTQGSSALLNLLTNAGVEPHLGVTTMDTSRARGALQGGLLTTDDPLVGHELARSLRVGTSGSELEAGLEAARLALIPDTNPAFRRAEAALLIVFISDEDDQSPLTVEAYHQAFLGAVQDRGPQGLRIVAVVPQASAPCPTITSPGVRYQTLTSLTGGLNVNICGFDWGSSLQASLPQQMGRQLSFTLSRTPSPGTVQVFVDNVEVPQGSATGPVWRYESGTVRFEPTHAPAPGASVRVRYRTQC